MPRAENRSTVKFLSDYVSVPDSSPASLDWSRTGSSIILVNSSAPVSQVRLGIYAPDWDPRVSVRATEPHWRSLVAIYRAAPALLLAGARVTSPQNDDQAPAAAWFALVRLAEVAGAAAGLMEDARIERPLLARLWFLLLSAPFRPRYKTLLDGSSSLPFAADELAFRARRAREAWARDVLRYDEHPILASRSRTSWFEDESRLLLWNDADSRVPLVLHHSELSDSQDQSEEKRDTDRRRSLQSHAGFAEWYLREFFLRRFALGDAVKGVSSLFPGQRLAQATGALSLLVLGLVGLWNAIVILPCAAQRCLLGFLGAEPGSMSAFLWHAGPALYALFLLLVMGAVSLNGSVMAYAHSLRLPAAGIVGVSVLVAIPAGWWAHPNWSLAAMVLVASTIGYLFMECIGHGVPSRAALPRTLTVTVLSWCHCSGVAAVAAVTVAPVFIGPTFPSVGAGPAARAITLFTTAAMALGVLLQMLWEDRPVTYPITHADWR